LRVILASIPPAARFPWLPEIETAQAIIAVNHWLRGYADRIGAVYADYHHALADPEGGMRPGLASDEVHPTDAGYSVMEPVALAAIRQAATLPKCRLRPA
jgi:lysophospholipase L1-like esterase